MKRKRFSEEQIVGVLNQAKRGDKTIGQICREVGVSEATFYQWRRKFGGLEVSEARRLRELERENARLKRLMAERDLEIDAMKELLSKKW
jgi:putative transposase